MSRLPALRCKREEAVGARTDGEVSFVVVFFLRGGGGEAVRGAENFIVPFRNP